MVKDFIMKVSVFLIVLFSMTTIFAQRLQVGMKVGAGLSFFHKGESTYENKLYGTTPQFGETLSLPVLLRFNKLWSLRTGIGYQRKVYKFKLNNFDFPQLKSNGGFYMGSDIIAWQIPIIGRLEIPTNKKFKWSYEVGVILTKGLPTSLSSGSDWEPRYSGEDVLYYKFSRNSNNFDPYKTFELMLGINYTIYKDKIRRHEFSASFEYGLNAIPSQSFKGYLANNDEIKYYEADIQPELSTLKITYTFYPTWWSFWKK